MTLLPSTWAGLCRSPAARDGAFPWLRPARLRQACYCSWWRWPPDGLGGPPHTQLCKPPPPPQQLASSSSWASSLPARTGQHAKRSGAAGAQTRPSTTASTFSWRGRPTPFSTRWVLLSLPGSQGGQQAFLLLHTLACRGCPPALSRRCCCCRRVVCRGRQPPSRAWVRRLAPPMALEHPTTFWHVLPIPPTRSLA